jgi:membrane protein YdbS with pleckstrin-like domain
MTDDSSQVEPAEVLFDGRPSTRPTVAAAVTVTLLTLGIVVWLFVDGESVVGDTSQTLAGVIGVLGSLVLIRLLGRLYALTRTSYYVTPTEIRRERAFLFSRSSREVPVSRIRGVKMTQTPFQRLFGYGSVAVLSAGPNQSLGFVSLEQVPDPVTRRDELRALLRDTDSDETTPSTSV